MKDLFIFGILFILFIFGPLAFYFDYRLMLIKRQLGNLHTDNMEIKDQVDGVKRSLSNLHADNNEIKKQVTHVKGSII